jgi:hypothetical protein
MYRAVTRKPLRKSTSWESHRTTSSVCFATNPYRSASLTATSVSTRLSSLTSTPSSAWISSSSSATCMFQIYLITTTTVGHSSTRTVTRRPYKSLTTTSTRMSQPNSHATSRTRCCSSYRTTFSSGMATSAVRFPSRRSSHRSARRRCLASSSSRRRLCNTR